MPTFITLCALTLVVIATLITTKPCQAAAPDASTINADEHIQFFDTSASFNTKTQEWSIPIHAWVYEPTDSKMRLKSFEKILKKKFDLSVEEDNRENFTKRTNLLISDNERGKRIVVELAGQRFVSEKSSANGHISMSITLPSSAVADKHRIEYQAIMPSDDPRVFKGSSLLIPNRGISVISDIDDTVKVTHVMDRKRLLDSTFLKDFEAVPGMAEKYREWKEKNVNFHFVSSSPWYLYEPLDSFLKQVDFPQATLNLKSFRFRDKSLLNLFKKGTETKPKDINTIIERYPEHHFILIGDSGEQDAEVYASIARQHPEAIKMILIRNTRV